MRPYAEPPATTETLTAFSSQQRWETAAQGTTYNAIQLKTDPISQSQISNLAQYAASLPPTLSIDFTQGGKAHKITALDAIKMFGLMNTLIQQARTIEANTLVDLGSAAPTIHTYEDVEARFAGVRKK
jgi:hypothetical protein